MTEEITPSFHDDQQGGHASEIKAEIALSLNRTAWESISPVSITLAILYTLFTVGHILLLLPGIKTIMVSLAAGTAIILFGIGTLVKRANYRPLITYPVMFTVFVLAVANSLLHLFLTNDILQTTNLILVIFGIGYFVLSTPWYFISLTISTVSWILFVLKLDEPGNVIHFGIAVFSANLISLVFHLVRKRNLEEGEKLRLLSESQWVEIEQAQEERDRFFNLSIDMLCVASFDGYFKHLSPAFEKVLGYSDQDLLEKPFVELVHPEDKDATLDVVNNLASGSTIIAFENRYRANDGSYKWILWNAAAFVEAGLIYAIGHDITAKKESLFALEEREQSMQAILNTTVDGIIVINELGIIQSFNRSASSIFGYAEEEVIGNNIRMLMPEPYHGEHDGYVSAYLDTRQPKIIGIGREVRGIRKNGEIFPLALAVSNVELPGRTLFTGIIRDITERKRAEEALNAARQRLQQEIDLAADIQTSVLPRELPTIAGFEFSARNLPARFLSGDFYDFIRLDENTVQVVLGDIAGKGIPAALMTLSSRSVIRNESTSDAYVVDVLNEVSRQQYQDLSRAELFVTLFLARLEGHTGQVWYASAGHGEALLWRHLENDVIPISATGLPLGIFPDEQYEETNFSMRPGDICIIFSDGITDAVNLDSEFFGIDRLVSIIQGCAQFTADELLNAVVQAIDDFSRGVDQEDDITVIVAKALPRQVSFELPATLEHLDQIVAAINHNAALYSDDFAYEVELASSEAVTNIIEHAYREKQGTIRVEMTLNQDGFQLDLFDEGEPFDVTATPDPNFDTPQESGYGISIMRQIMDEMLYEPGTERGNHWRLVKFANGG